MFYALNGALKEKFTLYKETGVPLRTPQSRYLLDIAIG